MFSLMQLGTENMRQLSV